MEESPHRFSGVTTSLGNRGIDVVVADDEVIGLVVPLIWERLGTSSSSRMFLLCSIAMGSRNPLVNGHAAAGGWAMCNLYSLTKGQQAILELSVAMIDRTGNLPPIPGIFPDYAAPIVRNGVEGRELAMARWGMPSPVFALEGKKTDPGVTNVRNLASPHWRRWTGVEHRCLVPFTSFSEWDAAIKGPAWFAFNDDRPLACFAGIWTTWTSVRKVKEGEVTADLYAFLTTEPNAEVGAIHPKRCRSF